MQILTTIPSNEIKMTVVSNLVSLTISSTVKQKEKREIIQAIILDL